MRKMPQNGLSRSRVYRIHAGIKARCYNPNSVPYPYYGAKGIRVCDEWLDKKDGFKRFYEWSMNNGYSKELSIDRIDPTGNYCPENCRWADKYTQNVHLNKPAGRSGYVGITKHTNRESWYGRVKVYGKCICTGSAPTALEAAVLREKYILEHGLANKLNGVI